jgi:hypothetical protein
LLLSLKEINSVLMKRVFRQQSIIMKRTSARSPVRTCMVEKNKNNNEEKSCTQASSTWIFVDAERWIPCSQITIFSLNGVIFPARFFFDGASSLSVKGRVSWDCDRL